MSSTLLKDIKSSNQLKLNMYSKRSGVLFKGVHDCCNVHVYVNFLSCIRVERGVYYDFNNYVYYLKNMHDVNISESSKITIKQLDSCSILHLSYWTK